MGTYKLYGDFDECQSIKEVKGGGLADSHVFSPKACHIGIVSRFRPGEFHLDMLGHPRYYFARMISVCAPSTCSVEDLESLANDILKPMKLKALKGMTYCQVPPREIPYNDWSVAAM